MIKLYDNGVYLLNGEIDLRAEQNRREKEWTEQKYWS